MNLSSLPFCERFIPLKKFAPLIGKSYKYLLNIAPTGKYSWICKSMGNWYADKVIFEDGIKYPQTEKIVIPESDINVNEICERVLGRKIRRIRHA